MATKIPLRIPMLAMMAAAIVSLGTTTAQSRMMGGPSFHMGTISGPRWEPHFHGDGPQFLGPRETVLGNCVAVQVPVRQRTTSYVAPPLPGQRPPHYVATEAPPLHGSGHLVTVCQ